jgi:hypothetical protein
MNPRQRVTIATRAEKRQHHVCADRAPNILVTDFQFSFATRETFIADCSSR